ncbi:hypothetical protein Pcinc_027146 [Petrolisthes cinctipes]|uniref:Uncharacterized protein n=1 Tax=Petrolisthes cinctipes TaxID=88211 RepID=A0AAE1F626_PETCI|nr:hypothetical protein Pcinc_027146 [Petrolisthes cinctipes]
MCLEKDRNETGARKRSREEGFSFLLLLSPPLPSPSPPRFLGPVLILPSIPFSLSHFCFCYSTSSSWPYSILYTLFSFSFLLLLLHLFLLVLFYPLYPFLFLISASATPPLPPAPIPIPPGLILSSIYPFAQLFKRNKMDPRVSPPLPETPPDVNITSDSTNTTSASGFTWAAATWKRQHGDDTAETHEERTGVHGELEWRRRRRRRELEYETSEI